MIFLIPTWVRVMRRGPNWYDIREFHPFHPINATQDKALLWKIDLWLIPWLSLLYLLSFLDRTNIGNAKVAKMEQGIGMTGRDYNDALTIFFVSYAGMEPITNVLLKKYSPRVFFTTIIFAWGAIMTLMGLVQNQAGLLACRWFLGLAEAGLFPGVNYYLS
jgi:MFS family permease